VGQKKKKRIEYIKRKEKKKTEETRGRLSQTKSEAKKIGRRKIPKWNRSFCETIPSARTYIYIANKINKQVRGEGKMIEELWGWLRSVQLTLT